MEASNVVNRKGPHLTGHEPVINLFLLGRRSVDSAVERGKTDKYGSMSAFDELSGDLGGLR